MEFSISIASGPDFDFKAALELFFFSRWAMPWPTFRSRAISYLAARTVTWRPLNWRMGRKTPSNLWIYLMSAHSLIHAFFVWAFTGSVVLGLAEFIIHWIIDALKCEGHTSFETDQWLHILTKVVFVALIWAGLVGGS